ncbi:DNA repair protein RecO [Putridiphycobacter roseus]|uniref:DNA repair protein RecO n=1 Tax=Putridiphycobacter roseus TaxID=2219161 RepID=A0A2W1N254_9FLAO|nr:DNA repair protein RecO [Putridiphycobacter roseus]PZE17031.1 DNA repair protein RecO [Putridiphycobacter roseus]
MAYLTTEGIVLQKTNYSETSLILKLFTLDHGLKSYIFQGAKRKNKKGNLASALSIIQLTYYQRNDSNLAKITAIEAEVIYKNIPFDPIKSSIVFFMNEVIQQTVKEEQYNPDLYQYLKNTLSILDLIENPADFAIQFLLDFTKQLGFYPHVEKDAAFFDLKEGKFSKYSPNHPEFIDRANTKLLLIFMQSKYDRPSNLKLNAATRRSLVFDLLKYYHLMFDNFKNMKTLPILEMTFHD